jgi:hypothetical protein
MEIETKALGTISLIDTNHFQLFMIFEQLGNFKD